MLGGATLLPVPVLPVEPPGTCPLTLLGLQWHHELTRPYNVGFMREPFLRVVYAAVCQHRLSTSWSCLGC